jgi:hypothetical protein
VRETNLVNLYFTKDELLEALELWCQNNQTAFTAHFRRRAEIDWSFNEDTGNHDLVVSFDGEVNRFDT